VDVGVAQARGLDADQHLSRPGLRPRHLLDDQRSPELVDDGGFHDNSSTDA
jgi:hypothetical protein